jgi:hypothetical protein
MAAPARGALHDPLTHQTCQRAARKIEGLDVWELAGTPCAAVIVPAGSAAGWEKGKVDVMPSHSHRRWGAALVAGLIACGAFGIAPVQAQSVPVIVPPISSVVVGIPPAMPPLIIGFPGDNGLHSRDGLTWSTTGRADVDVDVDINRQHGQAAAG